MVVFCGQITEPVAFPHRVRCVWGGGVQGQGAMVRGARSGQVPLTLVKWLLVPGVPGSSVPGSGVHVGGALGQGGPVSPVRRVPGQA